MLQSIASNRSQLVAMKLLKTDGTWYHRTQMIRLFREPATKKRDDLNRCKSLETQMIRLYLVFGSVLRGEPHHDAPWVDFDKRLTQAETRVT